MHPAESAMLLGQQLGQPPSLPGYPPGMLCIRLKKKDYLKKVNFQT